MIRKTVSLVLNLAALAVISVIPVPAQSNQEVAATQSVNSLLNAQNAELLERRVQRLELLERQKASVEVKEKQGQRLEGSWIVTVAAVVPPGAPPPPVRSSYMSFSRGGVAMLSERHCQSGLRSLGTHGRQ